MRSKTETCPFCGYLQKGDFLLAEGSAFARMDEYPVNPGHILLIPKEHVVSFVELPEEQARDLFRLAVRVIEWLESKHAPDGFNIGMNQGVAAGQTIEHLHIHVIPRYKGDVEDPTGGVRNVIPEKGPYPTSQRASPL